MSLVEFLSNGAAQTVTSGGLIASFITFYKYNLQKNTKFYNDMKKMYEDSKKESRDREKSLKQESSERENRLLQCIADQNANTERIASAIERIEIRMGSLEREICS